MRSQLLVGLVSATSVFLLHDAVSGQEVSNSEVSHSEVTWDQVQPVFQKRCFACHRGEQARGGLDLSSVGGIKAGSVSGAAVVSGKPDQSMIYTLAAHLENPHMPPNSARLPQRELDLIFGWIQGGLSERVISSSDSAEMARTAVSRPRPRLTGPVKRPAKPKPAAEATESPAEEAALPLSSPSVKATVRPLRATVTAIAASPTASVIAVAGHREVFLYQWTDQTLLMSLPFPAGDVFVLRFSRDGSTLLVGGGSGGASGKVIGFDVATGSVLFEAGNERDVVLAADVSPDGRLIALGGPSRVVRVYDTVSGEMKAEMKKHTDWILSLAFSNDGLLLASGDRFGSVQIWEAERGTEFHTLRGHTGSIHGLTWSADSNTLTSVSEDGSFREWDMHSGTQQRLVHESIGGLVAADSAAIGTLIVGSRSGKLAASENAGQSRRVFAMDDEITDLAITQDATHVVVADVSGCVRLFQLQTGVKAGEIVLPR